MLAVGRRIIFLFEIIKKILTSVRFTYLFIFLPNKNDTIENIPVDLFFIYHCCYSLLSLLHVATIRELE